MKLPSLKRILREDIKGAPDWADAIIDTFNGFAENVYQALNRNVTFSENVACFIKEITYRTTASYPTQEAVEFSSQLKFKATGLIVLQAVEKTSYEPAAGPVYAPWVEENGKIRVGSITGLQASKVYLIRFLVS